MWIQQHVALDVGGLTIPVPWYQSIDPLFSIFGVPLLFWLWRRQASRRREPGDLAKIGIGAWLAAASNLVLVVAILARRLSARAPDLAVPVLRRAGNRLPLLLAHAAGAGLARRAREGQRDHDGLAFMSLFVANNLIGWIGGFYEAMTPVTFWTMHAAIGATGGMLVMLFGRRLSRTFETSLDEPVRLSARALEVE